MSELSIIQKTYDFIKWYVPILNRIPRRHQFMLGDRMINVLYVLLEQLVEARYSQEKLNKLRYVNSKLDLLRYQTRLLLDFELISKKRYEYASRQMQEIGNELGGWIKQQEKL